MTKENKNFGAFCLFGDSALSWNSELGFREMINYACKHSTLDGEASQPCSTIKIFCYSLTINLYISVMIGAQIELGTVLEANLTGRECRQKLQCLYGNPFQHTCFSFAQFVNRNTLSQINLKTQHFSSW